MTRRVERIDHESAERELRALLRGWDPIGVFIHEESGDPWPEDEYDCLIPGILSRLRAGEGEDQLFAFLEHEQVTHFGIASHTVADKQFAQELVSWWERRERSATNA